MKLTQFSSHSLYNFDLLLFVSCDSDLFSFSHLWIDIFCVKFFPRSYGIVWAFPFLVGVLVPACILLSISRPFYLPVSLWIFSLGKIFSFSATCDCFSRHWVDFSLNTAFWSSSSIWRFFPNSLSSTIRFHFLLVSFRPFVLIRTNIFFHASHPHFNSFNFESLGLFRKCASFWIRSMEEKKGKFND